MPDNSLPPSWGPAPFDERDLDAVLSGETADIPPALRSVADTLAVLRGAAPTPAELHGEAAIMAEYRALGLRRSTGPEQTLVLPAQSAGRSPRRAPRHRASRRRVPSVGRRAGALMGVAAVVLIGVAVTSGNLSGPIERITHLGRTSSPSPSATHGGNVQVAGATPTKSASTPDPTPTHGQTSPSLSQTPTPSPGKLCQEVFGYQKRPESRDSWLASYRQLSTAVGSSDLQRLFRYCVRVAGNAFHDEDPATAPQESQNQQGHSQGNAPANAAKATPSPAASPTPTAQGPTGSSNANGNSGPGQGSQGGGPGSNS
jgi:hypothetical protein